MPTSVLGGNTSKENADLRFKSYLKQLIHALEAAESKDTKDAVLAEIAKLKVWYTTVPPARSSRSMSARGSRART
mgnify:CR=1 FL=1